MCTHDGSEARADAIELMKRVGKLADNNRISPQTWGTLIQEIGAVTFIREATGDDYREVESISRESSHPSMHMATTLAAMVALLRQRGVNAKNAKQHIEDRIAEFEPPSKSKDRQGKFHFPD